jgi:hypothetical protein
MSKITFLINKFPPHEPDDDRPVDEFNKPVPIPEYKFPAYCSGNHKY